MNELITKARELYEEATPGSWEDDVTDVWLGNRHIAEVYSRCDAAFIAVSRTLVPQLCDALEAAEKELIDYHHTQQVADGKTVENARMRKINEQVTARAEKAEMEIESIHDALDFANKSRAKCTNYTELAVSNGLALGKIAVAIQHDYNSEPPKGE